MTDLVNDIVISDDETEDNDATTLAILDLLEGKENLVDILGCLADAAVTVIRASVEEASQADVGQVFGDAVRDLLQDAEEVSAVH